MIEIEEGTLHLEANSEVMMIQEGYIEGQIITEIKVTTDKQGLEVMLDPLPEDKELHWSLLAEIRTHTLVVGSLVIL